MDYIIVPIIWIVLIVLLIAFIASNMLSSVSVPTVTHGAPACISRCRCLSALPAR